MMMTGAIEAVEVEEGEEEEEAAAAVISKKQMSFKQDWKAFCVASTSWEKSEFSAALFKLINNIKFNHDTVRRRSSSRRK